MSVHHRAVVSLPFPTNTRYQTKCTMRRGGRDAYQMLPDPVTAVRTTLVILDWSTNGYQSPDLALHRPCRTFTNHYHRTEGRGMTDDCVGLELVVGGAVDEGDVVLSFIG